MLKDLTHVLKTRIQTQWSDAEIAIQNDSGRHAHHIGNTGGGHYALHIVSEQFSGLSLVQRHRLVYQLFDDLIPDQIHALALQTMTRKESRDPKIPTSS